MKIITLLTITATSIFIAFTILPLTEAVKAAAIITTASIALLTVKQISSLSRAASFSLVAQKRQDLLRSLAGLGLCATVVVILMVVLS